MAKNDIKNLPQLIQQYTGNSKTVVDSKVSQLTAPGENYMGIVLKVEATLKDNNGKKEKFSAVAKCLNFDTIEFLKRLQHIQYLKEKLFYSEIIPTLQKFQDDEGIVDFSIQDLFPLYYAGRCNLDDSGDPDENAVLLFENLCDRGYMNPDRTVGIDLAGARLILKDLAVFHGVPIALKLKKSDVFDKEIKKHIVTDYFSPHKDKEGPKPPHPGQQQMLLDILEKYEETKPYLEIIKQKIKNEFKFVKEMFTEVPAEPFGTICHADLWTNNIMQRYEGKTPIKNKFIDFQIYNYGSAAKDLLFFLWSSVELSILKTHFDDLVKFYHEHLLNVLGKFNCDTTPHNYEHFLEELNVYGKMIVFLLASRTISIFAKKGLSIKPGKQMKKEYISEEAEKRIVYLISTFGKRGWL